MPVNDRTGLQGRRARPLACLLAISLVTATVASSAMAVEPATWYAAPGGAGDLCTQASPCTLEQAVETQAQAGDTVLAASGTYAVADPVNIPEDVALRGAGAEITVIEASSALDGRPTVVSFPGSTLSDVTLENHSPDHASGVSALGDALVERIVARPDDGVESAGCHLSPGTILRDSVCIGRDPGVAALALPGEQGANLINVTAVGTEGPGLEVVNPTALGGTDTIGSNVIALSVDGGPDVVAPSKLGFTGVELHLDHSNYDSASDHVTPPGTNGNQTAEPIFTADGYHQADSSPTVDAGSSAAALGERDIDGQVRVQGVGVDIGADELLVVPDPIEELSQEVEGAELPHGLEQALMEKLAAAAAARDAGNIEDACGALRAFANQVQAQRGKKISVADADDLLLAVSDVIDSLGCRP